MIIGKRQSPLAAYVAHPAIKKYEGANLGVREQAVLSQAVLHGGKAVFYDQPGERIYYRAALRLEEKGYGEARPLGSRAVTIVLDESVLKRLRAII